MNIIIITYLELIQYWNVTNRVDILAHTGSWREYEVR